MLLSLALIFLIGMCLGKIFSKLKLPSLIGMLLTGIILGPYVLNLLDGSILGISAELRKIALIIILARAGMNLDLDDLKKVGRPAVLMCFLPATFEIFAMYMLAPKFLGITQLEALVLGCVIAAVSPAVVVPRMLKLTEEKYGTNKRIPQIIMAGASVDDVFVIVLFTVFVKLLQTGEFDAKALVNIPLSIIFGIIVGAIVGYILTKWFTAVHMRDSAKVIIMLSISFILVTIEDAISDKVGFSGLLAIMAMGIVLKMYKSELTVRLSNKFSKLWVGAEILLFVLVGATVNIQYAFKSGAMMIVLIVCVTAFRLVGVYVCLLKTDLNLKERIFTAISYTPKATVQAAIGGIPLSLGLACGETVLTVAVLSILITAPFGAFLIDNLYQKFLTKQ